MRNDPTEAERILRAHLLRAALELNTLELAAGGICARIADGELEFRLEVRRRPTTTRETEEATTATEGANLRARILSTLTSEPMPTKRLCRLVGARNGSYFRGIVADLVREKLVRRTPDGLCLPS